ncbi:MAG: type II toxin-antitoxin system ParD family antitoxin [Tepidisphaeraceae bacterium]|jgi:antitoxin ParD1/3/4
MPTKNVNLSEQQSKFVRRSIGQGRFRNASEVVRAGLRLLEQREKEEKLKLAALRRVAAGAFAEIDQGRFEDVDPDHLEQFLDGIDAKARSTRFA